MIAILDNLRSIQNVGAIFRTSDALGIEYLYLCGTTPQPHPLEPWRKDHLALAKTALGAEKSVKWEHNLHADRVVKELKDSGYQIIVLENQVEGIDLATLTKPKEPWALVVGSETDGVSLAVLEMADAIVSIPMLGTKESLNVSVAFGTAAYWLLNTEETKRTRS